MIISGHAACCCLCIVYVAVVLGRDNVCFHRIKEVEQDSGKTIQSHDVSIFPVAEHPDISVGSWAL